MASPAVTGPHPGQTNRISAGIRGGDLAHAIGVTCRVCAVEFADKMMEMQRWLDHCRSRAENFKYYKLADDDVILVQLDFPRVCRRICRQDDGDAAVARPPPESHREF